MVKTLPRILLTALFLAAAAGPCLAAEAPHCLSADEQRAAISSGKAIPLASVIGTLHLAPREMVKARLCQESDRLIYLLTLLGRDGKVKRATVDAANGTLVTER